MRALTVLPQDEHNKTLVENVHPENWKNPEPAPRYNLVVIGGGTAGLVTAGGAASIGAKVALVERHLLGGDCLNVGCVPSKLLICSARVMGEARRASKFGVNVDARVDFSVVMERLRRIRAQISVHDGAENLKKQGVDVFLGEGIFTGPNTIKVDGKILHFKKAVIATGARAGAPPIEGLKEAGFLTNETVFNLTELPRRLAVIGGGPIGCELAQAFSRLGSKVTIVEMMPQFLINEDRDAAEILAREFSSEGVVVRLNTGITRVSTNGKEKILHLKHNEKGDEENIAVDEILVGVGRIPNTDGLSLEAARVEYTKFGVTVNDKLQTTNPAIYAAGDVCMKYKFTHAADAAAKMVIQNALFLGRKKLSALNVPWCTYTDPEIAHVGLYEKDAKEKGIEIETLMKPMSQVDRAILDSEEEGFVKIHIKKGSDKIAGATIVARHAGEMISELTLAMAVGVGAKTIANVIHPYPTQADTIRKASGEYYRRLLTPFTKKLLSAYLSWTR